jgi:hypothetical protein
MRGNLLMKKTYEKPAVESQPAFETLSACTLYDNLACLSEGQYPVGV